MPLQIAAGAKGTNSCGGRRSGRPSAKAGDDAAMAAARASDVTLQATDLSTGKILHSAGSRMRDPDDCDRNAEWEALSPSAAHASCNAGHSQAATSGGCKKDHAAA